MPWAGVYSLRINLIVLPVLVWSKPMVILTYVFCDTVLAATKSVRNQKSFNFFAKLSTRSRVKEKRLAYHIVTGPGKFKVTKYCS
jgi:hypothetical protein